MKFNTLEKNEKSNYKTFLTIIVAIAIIGIMILIGFWAYNEYNQYTIESDAEKAIEDFDKNIYEVVLDNKEPITEEKNQDDDNYTGKTTTTTTKRNNTSSSNTKKSNYVQTPPTKKLYKGFIMAGYIQIPRTGIKVPIVESVSTNALNVAIGKLMGPELNEPGNVVLMGHNFRNRTLFSKNANIRVGDKIYITDYTGQKLTYTVYNTYITDPDDSGYYTRTTDGTIEISLSSCTNDNENRIIIWARVE